MAYLTLAEYVSLGGIAPEADFTNLERKARHKLDYFTIDRLKTATVIISDVKELMTEFINRISATAGIDGTVSSYSNGIESVSYNDGAQSITDNELFALAVEYLPVELISQDMSQEVLT